MNIRNDTYIIFYSTYTRPRYIPGYPNWYDSSITNHSIVQKKHAQIFCKLKVILWEWEFKYTQLSVYDNDIILFTGYNPYFAIYLLNVCRGYKHEERSLTLSSLYTSISQKIWLPGINLLNKQRQQHHKLLNFMV